ncbi:nicotinate-nucleotide adenylyltransferase [bacterium]|nr:nicotinate-nucleotide adenylyltransferase [bacterium]
MNMPSETNLKNKATKTNNKLTRIGILGGTFDPIHIGHINPAKQVAKWLNLDKLTLLPVHIPPHKSSTNANALQRKHMVNLVCQNDALFELDARELSRQTPSFTVETLQEIKRDNPSSQIFFIIGMDSLLSFTSWHQWQEILTLCHLVVNTRPAYDLDSTNAETDNLLKKHRATDLKEINECESGRIFIHGNQHWNVSSTELRAQLKNSKNTNNLIPALVMKYIQQEQLYR